MSTDELVQACIDDQAKTEDGAGPSAIGLAGIARDQARPFDPLVPNTETIEPIEEAENNSGSLWPFPESFEFVEELIEDFDAALEKRRNQELQFMGLTWSRSKERPVF